LQIADLTAIDHLFHLTVETLKTHFVPDLEDFSRLAGSGDDLIALTDRETERLFTKNMLSRLQRHRRRGVVLIICQGNDDRVEFVKTDDITPVRESQKTISDKRLGCLETFAAAAAHGDDFYSVELKQVPQMSFTAKPTGTE